MLLLVSVAPKVRFRVLLPASTVIAIIFQLLIAFTQGLGHYLYLLHLYSAIQMSISVLAAFRMSFDSANPSGRRQESWTAMTLGLAFAPIPTGLLLAQFLSNITFDIEDTYFT